MIVRRDTKEVREGPLLTSYQTSSRVWFAEHPVGVVPRCFTNWQHVANVKDTVVKAPRCRKYVNCSKVRKPTVAKTSTEGLNVHPSALCFRGKTIVRIRLLGDCQAIL